MATEQEELIEQLKEIVESLKSVSQYSKDLASAIASANRPMQQLSDYSKAISNSMESMSKAMEQSTESMTGLTTDVSDLMAKMGEINKTESDSLRLLNEKQAALAAQKTETEQLRAAHVAIKVEQDRYWTEETKAGKARNEALKDTANLWEKIKKSITEAHSKDEEGRVKEYTFGTKSNTIAQGLTGASNVAGGLQTIATSLGQLFPVAGGLGGLLGMIMYGKVKEAEFNALGQVAAQQFDQIGGYSDQFANRLTGLTRKLSVAGMAAKEDIAKVSASMVEMGLTAQDAQTKIDGFTSAAGNDFFALSLSMDKAFEMAAGTTAKFAGTLVRDFNMSTKDAANNLMLMAQAAKDSGANVAVFMQQTMEASSALRMMNANQEAVFSTQARVSKAYQAGGLNQQFAGAYAAQGTQQLTGAIGGGMNEGVRAVLAQRMFGGDALDALYKLQSPIARGNEKLDVNQFVQQMGSLMKESGVEGQGAKYRFSEGVFGVGTAGADAFMKAIEEQEKTGRVSQQTQDEIAKGLTKEADKMSVLTRIAEQIKDAVANTMVGLLGMIVNGIKILYNAIMAGHYALMDTFAGPGGDEESRFRSDEHIKNIMMASGAVGKNASQIEAGMSQAAEAGGMAFKQMGLKGGWDIDTSPFVRDQLAKQRAQEAQEARDRAIRHKEVTKQVEADPDFQQLTDVINDNKRFKVQVKIQEMSAGSGNKKQAGFNQGK